MSASVESQETHLCKNVGHLKGCLDDGHRVMECSKVEKQQEMMMMVENSPQLKRGEGEGEGECECESSSRGCSDNGDSMVLDIAISGGGLGKEVLRTAETKGNSDSGGESCDQRQVSISRELNLNGLRYMGSDMDEVRISVASPKKSSLSRSDSSQEHCRVCQHQSEEPLIDLGCQCRGGLAKAHLSCINTWFSTRGSNKCEICQGIAVNVPSPESQPSRNYWIWRINPNAGIGREQSRGCYSPLWVAFSILIGGLLLDVLISISLGVSALPVNIIIGVLVVLGLGTALRLAFECCQELSARRAVQRGDPATTNPEFHPSIWPNL